MTLKIFIVFYILPAAESQKKRKSDFFVSEITDQDRSR
jgi:hypothetical protein